MQLPRPRRPGQEGQGGDLYQFDGLGRTPVTEATAGNIIAMSGIGDITIGDTIAPPPRWSPLSL